MAHFYGSMKGNRGETTRCGTKDSGIYAYIRGWDIGVHVEMYIDKDGNDQFIVYETGGSNNSTQKLIYDSGKRE